MATISNNKDNLVMWDESIESKPTADPVTGAALTFGRFGYDINAKKLYIWNGNTWKEQ